MGNDDNLSRGVWDLEELARNACLGCSDSVIMHTLYLGAGYLRAGGGMVSVVQQWSGDEWQDFALGLLQSRHGPMAVHKIPSSHQGDLGIDFYCISEAIIYQCYAVEEPIDISTRALRQKAKITSDLQKMVGGADDVSKLFLGHLVKNWVLLVPLHDSKDVNLHCAKKTADLRAGHHRHLDAGIEVCIQDQKNFPGRALEAAMASLTTLSLSVGQTTKEDLDTWQASSADLLANAKKKLAKKVEPAQVQGAVADGVEYFLKSNALIDALRSSAPDLHEKVAAAISGKTRRLSFAGPQGGPAPNNIMNAELDSLMQAIKSAAPTLSELNAQDIALGTVADWIMRCPLDFP